MKQISKSISKTKSKITIIEREKQIYFWWITGLLSIFLLGWTVEILGSIDSLASSTGPGESAIDVSCKKTALIIYGIFTFLALCAAIPLNGWKRKLPFVFFMIIGSFLCFSILFSLRLNFTF